ncbi:hypothetical protein COTS27_00977 [Spirochaetota bacterium]|nr:hypothetical protein COTS27_00977 [Spirochaetota bacterium]
MKKPTPTCLLYFSLVLFSVISIVTGCGSSSNTASADPGTLALSISNEENIEEPFTFKFTELPTTAPTVRIKPCQSFVKEDVSVLVNNNPNSNYSLRFDPPEPPSPYYDDANLEHNTHLQTITIVGTPYTVMFDIVIQKCSVFGLLGSGRPHDPWLIDNDLRLNLLSELINDPAFSDPTFDYSNHHYKLTADIDLGLNNAPWSMSAAMRPPTDNKGFTPIGTTLNVTTSTIDHHTRRFKGNFNCDGKTISNLFISNTTLNSSNNGHFEGLFGIVTPRDNNDSESGVIRNCKIVNANITGHHYVGAIVGYLQGGKIMESYAVGTVTGNSNIGGLAGALHTSEITNSYSAGTVSGIIHVGGLAGHLLFSDIKGSYASQSITGTDYIGGLAGFFNSGTITNSYASGSITGTEHIGGLAGFFPGQINNSYSITSITGTDNIGGLIGLGTRNPNNLINSYWNTETAPTVPRDANGRTTAQMQTRIADWNTSVWNFTPQKYPRLINVACPNHQFIPADDPAHSLCQSLPQNP